MPFNKIPCPRCGHDTHPAELVPAWYGEETICLKCLALRHPHLEALMQQRLEGEMALAFRTDNRPEFLSAYLRLCVIDNFTPDYQLLSQQVNL